MVVGTDYYCYYYCYHSALFPLLAALEGYYPRRRPWLVGGGSGSGRGKRQGRRSCVSVWGYSHLQGLQLLVIATTTTTTTTMLCPGLTGRRCERQ